MGRFRWQHGPPPKRRHGVVRPDTRAWRRCPICNAGTTTSICSGCAEALVSFGVPLPPHDATPSEIAFWARVELWGATS
jgi:hypothetical protein